MAVNRGAQRPVRVVLLAVLALTLAACGVRGPLEPPPGQNPDQKKNDPFILDKAIGS
jgi:predicted small lipoprotein YifL